MTNNILLGPDAQVRFSLQLLRAYEGKGVISGATTPVIDGIFLSNDPEAGVSGSFTSSKDNAVKLEMRVNSGIAPRWQAMHITMGEVDLTDAAIFGIMARSFAPASVTTRICIRTGRDDQFVDTFFPKTMVSFGKTSTHLDVLDLNGISDLPRRGTWREMILFFRPGDVNLDLLDLRVFVA